MTTGWRAKRAEIGRTIFNSGTRLTVSDKRMSDEYKWKYKGLTAFGAIMMGTIIFLIVWSFFFHTVTHPENFIPHDLGGWLK